MGYFTREELAFYYALADAFTICDHYFCSVLGPTDPNRVMALSATIDPHGADGGPADHPGRTASQQYGKFTWKTMPEPLLEAGVSWKVYNDPTGSGPLQPAPLLQELHRPDHRHGASS